jgi:molybdopterin converting factor small subunit
VYNSTIIAMQINVRLFLSFRAGRFHARTIECPAGTTVAAVAGDLALPDEEIGLVLVNDRQAETDRELADGDTLALFPVVGGG